MKHNILVLYNTNDKRYDKIINKIKKDFPETLTEKNPNLVYVIGGDGSMLAAHKKLYKNIPFFGHGSGTLNFIMNTGLDDSIEIIRKLKNGDISLDIIDNLKIKVSVEHKNKIKEEYIAINDIVIGNDVMDWHKIMIDSADGAFDNLTYKGMGICISTPLGSTAFNMNNFGKVLPLGSNVWSISSIVGDHDINEIMIPQQIEFEIKSPRENPSLYIDGRTTEIKLHYGDKIIIDSSKDKFQIAFLDKREFHLKRTKLIQSKR